jgi:epoxide hydrolase-like predicted phosphatase
MQLQYNSFKDIKNIIFDFGEVVLNIDYDALVGAFRKLGIKNFDELFSKAKQSDLFDNFEKGLISEGDFVAALKKISNMDLSTAQIIDAWNAILLDLPKERVELIKRLKKNHRTFLLSNTNNTHIKKFESDIEKTIGLDYFYSAFDKVYYSSRMKMRKPDAEIFEFVLKENGLKPEETLFIDDSPQHIEGGKRLGINAILLEKGKTIKDIFGQTITG